MVSEPGPERQPDTVLQLVAVPKLVGDFQPVPVCNALSKPESKWRHTDPYTNAIHERVRDA